MNLLLLPACALGMHRRDRNNVWRDERHYRSVCIGCGKPMVRNFDRWRISSDSGNSA
jgi:hypothetical protein